MNTNASFAFVAVLAVASVVQAACTGVADASTKGWIVAGSAPKEYEFGAEPASGMGGTSAFIKARSATPSGFGTLMQEVAADNYRGQRLQVSALIKTQEATSAQLWMRIDGKNGTILGFYNMDDQPVTGTKDWKRYNVVLDVPQESEDVAFGYFLNGSGKAWAADFKLVSVSKETPVSVMPGRPMPKAPVNMNFSQ